MSRNNSVSNNKLIGVAATFIMFIMLTFGYGAKAKIHPKAEVINGIEYVNVRYEPQHRHEFENELVRIYDVILPPRYVTLYHAHFLDTIYAIVHGSTLSGRVLVGNAPSLPKAAFALAGFVLWNGHKKEPLIHEVTNEGDSAARLLGVELKFDEKKFARQPVAAGGLTLKDTYSKVRVYELALAPGESTGEMDIDFSGLLIALTESSISFDYTGALSRTASLEPASWEWLEQPGKINITNVGISPFKAVFYELPVYNRIP